MHTDRHPSITPSPAASALPDVPAARQVLVGPRFIEVGPAAMVGVADRIAAWGVRTLIITGDRAYAAAREGLEPDLRRAEIQFQVTSYGNECSEPELARLQREGHAKRVQSVLGIGGGKALDTAKLIAHRLGVPVLTLPTSAATCAAWTALSNVYTPEGAWSHGVPLPTNPEAVVVDYDLIARAPTRLLASGMADTLAKWYETSASVDLATADGTTLAAHAMARHLQETILAEGGAACRELALGKPGRAFRAVVDANVVLAGTVGGLGGERCRSVAAHALCNAMTAMPGNPGSWHGEKVGFGILCQLFLQDRPLDEIRALATFFRDIALPLSLGALGYAEEEATIQAIAARACAPGMTMHHLPFPVTNALVERAIQAAQQLGQNLELDPPL